MICTICGQEISTTDVPIHHLHPSVEHGNCYGCWMAKLELQKFLLRATFTTVEGGRTIMGDWTADWLREILADPLKHRQAG